jgi:RoxA-like, cytochrome c-like
MNIRALQILKSITILCGLVGLSNQLLAQPVPWDEAKAAGKIASDFPIDEFDYFRDMDMIGDPNNSQPVSAKRLPLDLDEIKGRNTWLMWCGGNEAFWDWLAQHSYGFLDFLKIVSGPSAEAAAEKASKRFKETGLINEPGCQVTKEADSYSGLFLQRPDAESRQPKEDVYGLSSGVIGLRLFKNPAFDEKARKKWDVQKYFADEDYFNNPKLVRPYRVGMSCAFCHVGPHPLNPPADPENPKWENLSSVIGAQYFRTRAVVGGLLSNDNFIAHVLESQLPGTIDTSLVVTDNINNANTMNAIFELPARLRRAGAFLATGERQQYENSLGTQATKLGENEAEKQSSASMLLPSVLPDNPDPTQNPRPVPRVLLDGSDSIGAFGALSRVYLNIGTYSERWNQLHNPLIGFRPQKPFKIAECEENSIYWQATKIRMPYLAKFFLKSTPAMRLKDAPGGVEFLKKDDDGKPVGVAWDPALKEGRRVFAQNCIACHSSKQPDFFGEVKDADLLDLLHKQDHPFYSRYREWALAAVEMPEFWRENFLSTDRRVPVSLIGTNAGRALATNGIAGHMWEDFTSETYKQLPPVGQIQIFNPFKPQSGDATFNDSFEAPGGGRGYYRPASLVGVWATAPFLHNNSVGLFNSDPSVKGRMEAFNDAISKLLVQARRDENDSRSWEVLAAEAAKKRYLGYQDESLHWKAPDQDGADATRLAKDHGLIWRTTQETSIQIPASQLGGLADGLTGLHLPFFEPSILRGDLKIASIPAGTPVDLISNLDPDKPDKTLKALALAIWTTKELKKLDPNNNDDQKKADELRDNLGEAFLEASKCPDLVMDRGHYTAAALTPKEQQNLIDLIKTF